MAANPAVITPQAKAQTYEAIDQAKSADGTVAQVLQATQLRGSSDVRAAEMLFYAAQAGLSMKMVRLKIDNSHVRVEPGGLYFMKGALEMKASTGGGIMKGLARKVVSGETFFVNEIHGSGLIYLEPTFGHFMLHNVTEADEGVIVDKGLFYAGTEGLDISVAAQKNISSALFGGEGWFQTRISGAGIAVIYSPVPRQEIMKIALQDGETLSVDGNFALMRTERVKFAVVKSSKSWVATGVSGEGLLQTFTGPGTVWIAPTQGVYDKMASAGGLNELARPPGSMGTVIKNNGK